jgi:hypothetical protein
MKYDDIAIQIASINRSQAYLRRKERDAAVQSENRSDLVATLALLAMVALSVVGLVAAVLGT